MKAMTSRLFSPEKCRLKTASFFSVKIAKYQEVRRKKKSFPYFYEAKQVVLLSRSVQFSNTQPYSQLSDHAMGRI